MKTCHRSVGGSDVGHQHHAAVPNIHSSSHLRGVAEEQHHQQPARGATSHSHGGGGGRGAFHSHTGSETHSLLHHGERSWGRTMTIDSLPESQQGMGERRKDPANHLHGLGETVVSGHSERRQTVHREHGQTAHREHEGWRRESAADGSVANGFERQASASSSFPHSLNR